MNRILPLASWLLVTSVCQADKPVDFNFDIKPILSDRCYICHGPDESGREGDLRLDVKSAAFAESNSGNADRILAPGDHANSELFLRVSSDDSDTVMPPPDSGLKLTAEEIELFKRWIDQGAEWKSHWSFLPIPKAPDARPMAEVIDDLVSRKLADAGFEMAPESDKRTLLRRLSFDISGLPPTIGEVNAFLADQSPQAYQRAVQRLLDSERFGERVASVWLDAARYSDTYGYQVDRERFVWPYRDWVIRQFNNNLPYDQFIIQQVAGDLLPHATDEQRLATTFNRLHPQKVEGGSVPEEFRIEYVADRTQTFATSMLGLTLECARCHEHKYDPISQQEYYQLTAFFDNIDEAGLYSYFTSSVPTPTLLLGDEAFKQKQAELRGLVKQAEAEVRKTGVQLRREYDALQPAERRELAPPQPVEQLSFDDWKANGKNQVVQGVKGHAVRLSGDDAVKLKQGNFARYEPFSISFWMNVSKSWERTVVFHRSRAWTDAASRGYECLIVDGHLTTSLIHFWPGNAISIRSNEPVELNTWQHVAITYDGSSRADGLQLYIDGRPAQTSVVRDNLYKQIRGGGHDQIAIGERFRDTGFKAGMVDEFQIFDRELQPAEVALLRSQVGSQPVDPTPEAGFQVFLANNETYQAKLADLQAARKAACDHQEGVPEIMVMQEMDEARQTYLLQRGDYTARGARVEPDTFKALPPLPQNAPRTRLGLAKWLVDPQHPLTARVAVNRLWQMVFGTGLVRTPEDFGSQGELPTHPELLDRLARDFIDHGWDTKRLIAQLVQSRTYRQSSETPPRLLEMDPENRLYGRSPSYRWPAEMLRDQALHVSNLLVEKTGGPPVKPYDLKQSFKPMEADKGDGLYRRSLYTYWKRTGPSPAMMALDAAKRDVCRVKRSRTSSPLQTLVLMNGPQFVEAARALAVQVVQNHQSADDRTEQLFLRLTSRLPSAEEKQVLVELYKDQVKVFRESIGDAKSYLQVGSTAAPEDLDVAELAATTSVANALLALDEVMMKR